MVLLVQGFQALPRDMGIDLGRRDVRMAEQKLDYPEVGAMVEQVGGEGVAQRVGREGFGNARFCRMALDQVSESLPAHHAPPGSDEEVVAFFAVQDERARILHVA